MAAHLIGGVVLLPAEFSVAVELPADGNHTFGHTGIDGAWHDVPSLTVFNGVLNVAICVTSDR